MRVLEPARLGKGVRLLSTGAALPAHVVTNADLVALGAPLTAEEMARLTGILARHWVSPSEATSDLALAACRQALMSSGRAASVVDRLVLATVSPDHPSPATACTVAHQLGMGQVPVYDVTATCSGFLYALDQAARAVCTGDSTVLACAADTRSRYLNVKDRATCALFGDGAGAAVVTDGPVGEGLLAVGLASDGSGFHSVYVPAGGSREPLTAENVTAQRHTIHMADGPQVYMHAVEGMLTAAEELLSRLKLTWDAVDLLVPHQANRRLMDRFMRLARLPAEKVFINVERVGNISGASTAVALHEALAGRRVKAGQVVMLLAAGAGYTAGVALLKVDETLLSSVAA